MNSLHERVEQYLAIRRSLGFKLEDHGRLPQLVTYLEQRGAATLTVEAALAWATTPQGVNRFRWRQRLSVVRGFARWLQPFVPATQVPPADLLAYRRTRPVPYQFSEADIDALLAAVTVVLRHPLRVATHRTLFGLLAVTGLSKAGVHLGERARGEVGIGEQRAQHVAHPHLVGPSGMNLARQLGGGPGKSPQRAGLGATRQLPCDSTLSVKQDRPSLCHKTSHRLRQQNQ